MSKECHHLHEIFNGMKRHYFPFNEKEIPKNGIYILFEKNETGHGLDRIVRIGTHTGNNQLFSRLKQHFVNENKDRSIFRKNIGRAILNQSHDPFLEKWELDLTTPKARELYASTIDSSYQNLIEQQVSQYIQNHFSFVVFEVISKEERLNLEAKIISTVSNCQECNSSPNWLGKHSPKDKIRESGLWLVNELYGIGFTECEILNLFNYNQMNKDNKKG